MFQGEWSHLSAIYTVSVSITKLTSKFIEWYSRVRVGARGAFTFAHQFLGRKYFIIFLHACVFLVIRFKNDDELKN
jgi:hypothetical protein